MKRELVLIWALSVCLFGGFCFPQTAVSEESLSFGDRLRSIIQHFEVWEEIVKRDYSIKQEQVPIEKTSPRYRNQIVRAVQPYTRHIQEASDLFTVPRSIIGGLIFMESSGKPDAVSWGKDGKAKSSARGLTQVTDETFKEIQSDLARLRFTGKRVRITGDRTDPRTAIIAGTYYLSKQFAFSIQDSGLDLSRTVPEHWCLALQYYYRGRKNVKGAKIVKKVVYTDGSKSLDPDDYCQDVLRYAEVLRRYLYG